MNSSTATRPNPRRVKNPYGQSTQTILLSHLRTRLGHPQPNSTDTGKTDAAQPSTKASAHQRGLEQAPNLPQGQLTLALRMLTTEPRPSPLRDQVAARQASTNYPAASHRALRASKPQLSSPTSPCFTQPQASQHPVPRKEPEARPPQLTHIVGAAIPATKPHPRDPPKRGLRTWLLCQRTVFDKKSRRRPMRETHPGNNRHPKPMTSVSRAQTPRHSKLCSGTRVRGD